MLQALDVAVLRMLRARAADSRLTRAVARFSMLGQHAAAWLALGALGARIDRGRSEAWAAAARRVVLAYALNTGLKFVIRRRRPQPDGAVPLAATPTQLSFPSAHATTSFAAARLYARLGLPSPLLHGLAAALAWSRVYLGVHYPSDVLGGALLGRLLGR